MPAGGITAITGHKKQGKTQFLAAVVATLMSGKDFGRMRRLKAPGKILWIDTEQSPYDISNTIGRVYHLAGIPQGEPSEKHGLTVLQLAALEPQTRRDVIADAVLNIMPEILVIDGVRDLMNDFNDITESGQVLTWLKGAMNSRPGMRVAVVLHTNPGTDKMRGHLGTEIGNKLNDQFSCSKDNGVFSVNHESRGREMLGSFIFCIDGHGQLSTSTVEQRAGVVAADDALVAAIPVEGLPWSDAVSAYKKHTGLTQAKAIEALKARLNANPPTLVKRGALFYRVEPGEAPARRFPFNVGEDAKCPF